MSTRLYLNWKDSEPGCYGFADFFGGWASWGGSQVYYGQMMEPVKAGEVSKQFYGQYFSSGPTVLYKGFSRRLQPQTLSGTFDGIFHAARNAAFTAPAYTRLFVYVVDTTGNPPTPVLKATLVNLDESTVSGAVPWPELANPEYTPSPGVDFSAPSRRLKAPVALTSYVIPNDGKDYRIYVEFGVKASGFSSGYLFTRIGTRSPNDFSILPDLASGASGHNSIAAPYFEFSGDLTFKASTYHANDEPERAMDMGSSITVGPLGTGSTSVDPERYYQWYKYTLNNNLDRSVSVLFCVTTPPGNTSSKAEVTPCWETMTEVTGPPFGIYRYTINKAPIMVALKAGCDLYLKTWRNVSPVATLSVIEGATGPILPGDLLITPDDDDPNQYDPTFPGQIPSMFYRSNGTISAVDGHIVSSELGVSLATGDYGIVEFTSNQVIIYGAGSATVLHKAEFEDMIDSSAGGGGIASIGTDFKDFYITVFTEAPIILRASKDGVVDSKVWHPDVAEWDEVGNGFDNIALSRDGKVLYAAWNPDDYSRSTIYRHDMVNDVSLPPFVPPDALDEPEEMLVLSDNTLIATFGYLESMGGESGYLHYSPDGTILHTYTAPGGAYIDHIVHDLDDSPDKVWVWLQGMSDGAYKNTNRFQLVRVSDSSTIQQFDAPQFRGNGWVDETGNCNSPRWGAPPSCPLIMMMTPKVVVVTPPVDPIVVVKKGIRIWALEVHPTILSAAEVELGQVKSGQVVTYRVRVTGAQNDPAEGELVNWYLSGAGLLLTAQSVTDQDGYARAQVQYGLTEVGASRLGATVLC